MSESKSSSTISIVVHWVAFVLLLLMMLQPTFDNVRSVVTGKMVMGEVSIDVTISQMALHLVAMTVGWVGLVLFFLRKKLGAYITVVAHLLGLVAVITQTPQMLEVMPPVVIGIFFVVMLLAALGPIFAFKDQYS